MNLRLLPLCALLLMAGPANAFEALPADPHSYVADFANIFSDAEESELLASLGNYERSARVQVRVITTQSTNGLSTMEYGTRIGSDWKVANKETGYGALLILYLPPSGRKIDTYLTTTGNLTWFMTDNMARRLLDERFEPKLPNLYAATVDLLQGFTRVIDPGVTAERDTERQHFLAKERLDSLTSFDNTLWLLLLIPVGIISAVLLLRRARRQRKAQFETTYPDPPIAPPIQDSSKQRRYTVPGLPLVGNYPSLPPIPPIQPAAPRQPSPPALPKQQPAKPRTAATPRSSSPRRTSSGGPVFHDHHRHDGRYTDDLVDPLLALAVAEELQQPVNGQPLLVPEQAPEGVADYGGSGAEASYDLGRPTRPDDLMPLIVNPFPDTPAISAAPAEVEFQRDPEPTSQLQEPSSYTDDSPTTASISDNDQGGTSY